MLAETRDSIPEKGRHIWDSAKDQWKFETSDVNEVLGLAKDEQYVKVRKAKLGRLLEPEVLNAPSQLAARIRNLTEYPLNDVLAKYENMVGNRAMKLQKRVTFDYAADSTEMSFQALQLVDLALVHIFRNCIDHGIEEVEEREKIGKPANGRISVGCFRKGTMFHLVIKDDGRGLPMEQLAARAIEAGIWTKEQAAKATRQDKTNLI